MTPDLMVSFLWALPMVLLVTWPDLYCWLKKIKTLSPNELEAQNPEFAYIYWQFTLWALVWSVGLVGLGLVLCIFVWSDVSLLRRMSFGAVLFSYVNLLSPVFAHFKKVYPVSKGIQYVWQPEVVQRLSQIQIALSLSVALIALLVGVLI